MNKVQSVDENTEKLEHLCKLSTKLLPIMVDASDDIVKKKLSKENEDEVEKDIMFVNRHLEVKAAYKFKEPVNNLRSYLSEIRIMILRNRESRLRRELQKPIHDCSGTMFVTEAENGIYVVSHGFNYSNMLCDDIGFMEAGFDEMIRKELKMLHQMVVFMFHDMIEDVAATTKELVE